MYINRLGSVTTTENQLNTFDKQLLFLNKINVDCEKPRLVRRSAHMQHQILAVCFQLRPSGSVFIKASISPSLNLTGLSD